jgi:response regulator aspartate phosphatase C
MHVKLKGQEFLIQTLNDWYISIRSRDVSKKKKLKQQSDEYVDYYKQEQNLYFYYSLYKLRLIF